MKSRMEDVVEYWAPNTDTGFIPVEIAITPPELAQFECPTIQLLGTRASHVGAMTDSELSEFVCSLSTDIRVNESDLSPHLLEGLVRSYVNIASHLIHRPCFADSEGLAEQVAVPLWNLSKLLNRPPSLTYASYVLSNFTAPVLPFAEPDSLTIGQTPSGTRDEEWFVAVHLAIESAGGQLVHAINTIRKALQEGSASELVIALERVEECMVFAERVMPMVKQNLDPDVFRDKIRSLLYGHTKVRFLGVVDQPKVTYIGETGAQSGVIKAVDTLLCVEHAANMTHSMDQFSLFAPIPHQEFYKEIRVVGEELRLHNDLGVKKARNQALNQLARFRKTHISVVLEYLEPNGIPISKEGSGGMPFKKWLNRLITETTESSYSK